MLKKLIFLFITTILAINVVASDEVADSLRYSVNDNIKSNTDNHSPKLATWMSVVVPGSGQIYNKKYWKTPIIYAGFAGLIYATDFYQGEYKTYRSLYREAKESESQTAQKDGKTYKVGNLQEARNFYRKGRDLCIIGMCLWYAVNIIDANVDAHFFDYDVSDDLSLRITPSFNQTFGKQAAMGFNLCLKF